MKILWSSNAPWVPSGYGQQTKVTVPALKSLGHDLGLIAWCGLEGARINLDNTPVYPKGGNPYGVDVLAPDAQDFNADIAITLIDAWVYDPSHFQNVRWVPYFPIDSEPVSPSIVQAVSKAYDRIIFTRFAEQEMKCAGLSCHYVPHMIDTEIFKPTDDNKWRKMMNMDNDVFIVGMVAANKGYPSRKSLPQCFEAFARFAARHENARLYMHSLPFEPCPGGSIDLPKLMEHLTAKYGVPMLQRVMWIQAYQMRLGVPPEYMRDMYNGINVLLSPSMGEGFGIPIVEAQACGKPVIVGDWTSMPELCYSGWQIDRKEAAPFWISGYNTYQFLPSIYAIEDRLEKAYDAWENKSDMATNAVKIAADYNVEHVTNTYWKPVLEEINSRINSGRGELKLVKF